MAVIPKIKAAKLAKNTIGTVTSHQWSSKDNIPSALVKIIETIIIIRKKAFSQTDHLPNFVCGFNCMVWTYRVSFILSQEGLTSHPGIKNSGPTHGVDRFGFGERES
jgi:hypothetical protein